MDGGQLEGCLARRRVACVCKQEDIQLRGRGCRRHLLAHRAAANLGDACGLYRVQIAALRAVCGGARARARACFAMRACKAV